VVKKIKQKTAPLPTSSEPVEVLAVKQEKILLTWRTVSRPYQKKNREFWTTILATLGLVCLILFFVKEWFLIAAFLAMTFFYYVLTTVEPEEVDYKITNKGIYLPGAEQRVDWEGLRSFWFSQKWGYPMVNLETWFNFPRLVHLVAEPRMKKELKETLAKYLPEGKEKKNFVDKFSSWLARQIPTQNASPKTKTTS